MESTNINEDSSAPTCDSGIDDGLMDNSSVTSDMQIAESLMDNCSVTSDMEIDENLVYNSVVTHEILREEQMLQLQNTKELDKQRKEYKKEAYNKEMKELRYKRLMHLLEKSQFFANFMHNKVEELADANKKSRKNPKNKKGSNKRKRENLAEDYSKEIISACKKHKETSPLENAADDKDTISSVNIKDNGEIIKIPNDETTATRVTDLGITVPARQPSLLEGGALRDYQLDGLDWMRLLFETGMNGILADEMGLGKTIQIISLICHLYENKVIGPFLIVCPLSTLPNWLMEFEKFAPQIPVILYHGTETVRRPLRSQMSKKAFVYDRKAYPVVLTSFEVPIRDETYLNCLHWSYIIVDEGHRLKNYKTHLSRTLSRFKTVNRLLLTGTPLQNNLTELWSLLNFLLPDIFDSIDAFHSWFEIEDLQKGGDVAEQLIEQEKKNSILSTLHKILSPFLLRRMKSDVNLFLPPKKEVIVYCPLTPIQKKLYESILDRTIIKLQKKKEESLIIKDNLDGTKAKRWSAMRKNENFHIDEETDNDESNSIIVDGILEQYKLNIKMLHVQMMLRKVVNHPYLVQKLVLPGSNILRVDDSMISSCGKLIMLDGLLRRLKERNHKVLIFSTFTMILDILEEFLLMNDYKYERLDGKCKLDQRKASIYSFNTDKEVFVFLISTRAGGLGINLTAADTVIIYDSDWNPQADLQAQDRCHRIGQTRPVIVYRLVTEGTVDEHIVKRASAKRKLERIIIEGGNFCSSKTPKRNDLMNYEDLKLLLTSKQHNEEVHSETVLKEDEWDALLDRSSFEVKAQFKSSSESTCINE